MASCVMAEVFIPNHLSDLRPPPWVSHHTQRLLKPAHPASANETLTRSGPAWCGVCQYAGTPQHPHPEPLVGPASNRPQDRVREKGFRRQALGVCVSWFAYLCRTSETLRQPPHPPNSFGCANALAHPAPPQASTPNAASPEARVNCSSRKTCRTCFQHVLGQPGLGCANTPVGFRACTLGCTLGCSQHAAMLGCASSLARPKPSSRTTCATCLHHAESDDPGSYLKS